MDLIRNFILFVDNRFRESVWILLLLVYDILSGGFSFHLVPRSASHTKKPQKIIRRRRRVLSRESVHVEVFQMKLAKVELS